MTDERWPEGPVTDRAIELLRMCAAKTDADGNVVPAHKYSRNLRAVIYEATWPMSPWDHTAFSLRREKRDDGTWGMVCEIEGKDGEWTQTGECWSDEGVHEPSALAICRALLDYIGDDDEPMTQAAIIAMLERCHQKSGR